MTYTSRWIGWGLVIAVLIGFGSVVGFVFGLMGHAGLMPSAMVPVMIGLVCGVAAPLLIFRMRPAR